MFNHKITKTKQDVTKYEKRSLIISLGALACSIIIPLFTLYMQNFRSHMEVTVSMMDLNYTGVNWYVDVVLVNSGNHPVAVKDILLFIRSASVSPFDQNLRQLEPDRGSDGGAALWLCRRAPGRGPGGQRAHRPAIPENVAVHLDHHRLGRSDGAGGAAGLHRQAL